MATNSDSSLPLGIKTGFFAIFFSTGFSALIFQVIWQRVLTVHAGVDLYSVTTVIAAFMTGLGMGSLLGGYVADRLTIRNCFILFSLSNAVIGIFSIFSLWLFYDFYGSIVHFLDSTFSSFLFHFIVLCIPTTLMGLSLPLLSKALVRTADEMTSLVGGLYGINTLGAAVGAGLGTWYLLGTVGFSTSIQIASALNIVSGILAITLLTRLKSHALTVKSGNALSPDSTNAKSSGQADLIIKNPTLWIVIYGLTGFAALSLEIVWFRLFAVIARSTSYVFGHVLFIFLCGVGFGSVISARMIKRVKRPDILFLSLQFMIGFLSLSVPLAMMLMPESLKLSQRMISLVHLYPFRGAAHFIKYFTFFNLFAILIFGLSTVLMGMCFPLIQRIVSRQMDTLGRNLSKLLFSNIIGNILGSIVTGFFFLDYFGSPLTLKILCLLLIIPGLLAIYGLKGKIKYAGIGLVIVLILGATVFYPGDKDFWKFFHGTESNDIVMHENRTSVNALIKTTNDHGDSFEVITNGHAFTSYIPFRGNANASKLGIALSLYHPEPKSALVIGFGSGNTLYSIALDKRLKRLKNVELSGGQMELLRNDTRRENLWQIDRIFNDPRIEITVGDGRKFLLHSDEKFDLIEIDPFHPHVGYTGNLISEEFFQLIKDHLKPGGIFCQWLATSRIERTILKVFPHVVRFHPLFALASNEPIKFDETEIRERLKLFDIEDSYSTDTSHYLIDFFQSNFPIVIQAGNITEYQDSDLNRDLFPKDEYFLNNTVERQHLRERIQVNRDG